MAAESALVSGYFVQDHVGVIAEEFLGAGDVNLAFIFLHELIPACVTGVCGTRLEIRIELRFFFDEFWIAGEI